MAGALMNLVAYGAQDVYLSGRAGMYDKFKIYYKKHIINDIVTKIEITGWEFIESVEYCKLTKYVKNMFTNPIIKQSIDCSTTGIKKLPKFKNLDIFNVLKYFNCSHNNLSNINKLKYISLIKLDCSYNLIKSIPNKMYSLEYLDLSNNQVEGDLDFLNYPELKYLMLSSNNINNVLNLGNKLIYLDLSNNPIKNLDNLPYSLEYLLVVKTHITKINYKSLPNLKYLDISINNSFNIGNLQNGLIYLNCSQSGITKLDNLPCTINKLICINNSIKSLNMLPESIEYLDCDHNKITTLDDLPNSLTKLICSHNELISLNNLPPKLEYLNCSNNKLVSLTNLPKSLEIIIDENNDDLKKNNDNNIHEDNDNDNDNIHKDNDNIHKNNNNHTIEPMNTFFKIVYRRYTKF